MQWYVIHTYSGHENKVKANIEKTIETMNLQDKIGKILIPTEEVAEIKGGKKTIKTKKYFPGYILIQMEMTEDTWHIIRHIPGVSGFVGAGNKPTPIPEEKVEELLLQAEGRKLKPKPATSLEKDDNVRVIDGPFIGFEGYLEEISPDKTKAKVMVQIFGRQTPVEIDILQLEKI